MNLRRYFHESRVVRPFLRWIVPAVVILLAVAGSGDSVGSGPTTSTGVQVTKSVPFVRESIDEIRALAPLRTRAVPGDRAIPFHRIPRRSGTTGEAGLPLAGPALAAPFFASSPAPSAPVLDSSFAGLGNPPHSEGDLIPPDTMGAAGPNHLVSLLNSDFGVFDKPGTAPSEDPPASVLGIPRDSGGSTGEFPVRHESSLRPAQRAVLRGDPWGNERPGLLGPGRRLLHVRSHGSLEQMGHRRGPGQRRAAVQQLGRISRASGWTRTTFTSRANMFNNGRSSSSTARCGSSPKPNCCRDRRRITWFEVPGSSGIRFHHAARPHLRDRRRGVLPLRGIFQPPCSWPGSTTPPAPRSGTPRLPVPVAPYTLSDLLPGAPQSGNDNTIDTSDTRLLNVVYRNGSLWTVHTVSGPSHDKTEVAWYRIDPGTARSCPKDGSATRTAGTTTLPSGSTKDDVAAIGFSGSSATEYVGGYYTVSPAAVRRARSRSRC